MNLLLYIYLHRCVYTIKFKLMQIIITYNVLSMASSERDLNFKVYTIKSRNYRVHLLNTSFYFLFVDYIYIINYFKCLNNSCGFISTLPVKIKAYSILRAPFVYSKSRENFSVQSHFLFFDINAWKLSEAQAPFYNSLIHNIAIDNSKLWYKLRVLF
jgi:hypothetical protein